MAFFPVDEETLSYLRFTADASRVRLGILQGAGDLPYSTLSPDDTDKLELDFASVEPTLAGPKRPQDRVPLKQSKASFESRRRHGAKTHRGETRTSSNFQTDLWSLQRLRAARIHQPIPSGPVWKKAVERGLHSKPWVKTSLAPGSKVVTDYLDAAGLSKYLTMGFQLVGYGDHVHR